MIKTMFREVGMAVVGFWKDLSWAGPKEGPLPKPRTLRIHPRALAVGMGRQRWGDEEWRGFRSSADSGQPWAEGGTVARSVHRGGGVPGARKGCFP